MEVSCGTTCPTIPGSGENWRHGAPWCGCKRRPHQKWGRCCSTPTTPPATNTTMRAPNAWHCASCKANCPAGDGTTCSTWSRRTPSRHGMPPWDGRHGDWRNSNTITATPPSMTRSPSTAPNFSCASSSRSTTLPSVLPSTRPSASSSTANIPMGDGRRDTPS